MGAILPEMLRAWAGSLDGYASLALVFFPAIELSTLRLASYHHFPC
jgi:hypothetical protein